VFLCFRMLCSATKDTTSCQFQTLLYGPKVRTSCITSDGRRCSAPPVAGRGQGPGAGRGPSVGAFSPLSVVVVAVAVLHRAPVMHREVVPLTGGRMRA